MSNTIYFKVYQELYIYSIGDSGNKDPAESQGVDDFGGNEDNLFPEKWGYESVCSPQLTMLH